MLIVFTILEDVHCDELTKISNNPCVTMPNQWSLVTVYHMLSGLQIHQSMKVIYPVYTEQKLYRSRSGKQSGLRSLFNTTKRITLFFIVQSLLHHSLPNDWIKII